MDPAIHLLTALHAEVTDAIVAGVKLAARAPPPWAALLVGAGLLYLLHGARRRHVLAVPGGVALGLIAVRLLATMVRGPGTAAQPELLWVAGGVGGLVCAGWPPAFPLLALGIPGFLVGLQLPVAGQAWLGGALFGAGGALLGALAREWVAALAAGGMGAASILAGAAGLLAKRPAAAGLLAHPMALFALWAILAVAGAAFHAGRAWPAPGRRRGGPEPFQRDRPVRDGPEYDG